MDFKISFFRVLYFSILILFTTNTFSQCFEIQSILVDACGGADEGRNEMVRFKVGNNPLNINALSAVWPNNSWQGIVQNTTTANKVTQLNSDVSIAGGCGKILEPTGGIIPPNATVILVTSFNMNTAVNPFGALSEDIYMIFQNNATTSIGHFSNYTSVPPNERTFSMTFGSGCSDVVVYNKSLLIKQNGSAGAEDGATVDFTPTGEATYSNFGCKAPAPPFTVDAGPMSMTVCAGTTITLNGRAIGQQSILWSSPSGIFSSPTTIATNYTISPEDLAKTIVLTLEATNNCGLKITDSLNLFVAESAIPNFSTILNLCPTDTPPDLNTKSPNGISGTWNPASISTAASADYIFTPDPGQCASQAALAVTVNRQIMPDFKTELVLCPADTPPDLSTKSPNGISGTWNPASISTAASADYIFTPDPGQCASQKALAVTVNRQIMPDFKTELVLCPADTPPDLSTKSPNGISGTWNPASISTAASADYIFTPDPGQCASQAALAVTVNRQIMPDFKTELVLCPADTPPDLSTKSPNGISGTWNPASISTAASADYIFTPDPGQCASQAALAVTVNRQIMPDFKTELVLCPADTPPDLSTKSPNGISGTWNPASISTAASADYIFTPDPGQCASQAALAVTVNRQIMPDFKTELVLCPADTPPDLSTKSPNGISGTWNPASISTAASADYIFTPDPGQCASQAALAVTVNRQIMPDFKTELVLCPADTPPDLSTKSPNGISGTWNPASISTAASADYIFTPDPGQCASQAALAVTVNRQIMPDFKTELVLCPADTPPDLSTKSPNGISGTWNPASISTAASADYIFTPDPGQCASQAALAVTVNRQIMPDFKTELVLCPADTPPDLSTKSPNGISGTWNPASISTAASADYIFTPDPGQCASQAALAVTVNRQIMPDFKTELVLCPADTPPDLSTKSPNGISGTWNPASISTAASADYIFTPDPGQCASQAALAVTVNRQIMPDFKTELVLCPADTPPDLSTKSPNGISGTWNPASISTAASADYIFTPDPGQCASQAALAVTVNRQIMPDFKTELVLCPADTPPDLSTKSPNGISGTWNPASISTAASADYIFTPDPGQCASQAALAVTVNRQIMPDFKTELVLCPADTPPDLSTKSPNGISGTWNPASISTAASADYIFTPDPGQCASQAALAVTVNRQIMPDFKTELVLCPADTPPDLSTKSPNGISGTWNPASISTAASADYIFTPDPGQCASQAALAVNLFSFSYSITQECINNKYLIKVVPNMNYPLSDYTYTWFNSKGVEIAYNTSAFDFTEYIKNLNTQPLESLEFKIRASNGSCEIEKTFAITNNLCGIQDTVSPNDDGINDNLDLSTLNITSITIFNRYGREVYNFKGKYNNQWYGQCKEGRLPAGTYFYIISTENEESRPGWVFLFY